MKLNALFCCYCNATASFSPAQSPPSSTVAHTLMPWTLIWTHCDTDDRVPGGWVEVCWRPGNVVIVKQGHHMRQGGEGDISHAVGLLNVNDHFSHLLPKRVLRVRRKATSRCL